jgi:small nuclear ribonucleoprotein (snRNP)-like protein
MLVELKNGETLNGHLVTCDTWMNLTLKEVVQTSPVYCPAPTNFYGGVPKKDGKDG